SSATITQTVNQAATMVAVSSAVSQAMSGQIVTFTAAVSISSPGTAAVASPTGTVVFLDSGTSIGQGTLSTNGGTTTASFSTASLAVGNHTILASYGGDSNFGGSSATLMQAVNPAVTTTAVSSSVNSSVFGQLVTFTATLMVLSPGSTALANPTG